MSGEYSSNCLALESSFLHLKSWPIFIIVSALCRFKSLTYFTIWHATAKCSYPVSLFPLERYYYSSKRMLLLSFSKLSIR